MQALSTIMIVDVEPLVQPRRPRQRLARRSMATTPASRKPPLKDTKYRFTATNAPVWSLIEGLTAHIPILFYERADPPCSYVQPVQLPLAATPRLPF
jgi:hypothetical protein